MAWFDQKVSRFELDQAEENIKSELVGKELLLSELAYVPLYPYGPKVVIPDLDKVLKNSKPGTTNATLRGSFLHKNVDDALYRGITIDFETVGEWKIRAPYTFVDEYYQPDYKTMRIKIINVRRTSVLASDSELISRLNSPLFQTYTASEADDKWGLPTGSVRQSCNRGELRNYIEKGMVRQSGKVWMVTEQAMIEVFGEPKKDE